MNDFFKKQLTDRGFEAVVLGLAAVFYFFLLTVYLIRTDIQLHIELLLERDYFPPHFFYFWLIYAFSGFVPDYDLLIRAAYGVICLSVFLKFIVSRTVIARYIEPGTYLTDVRVTRFAVNFAAFLMLFCFALPVGLLYESEYYYFGLIPPNVWHNSTTIFLMPFALLLFWKSYRMIEVGFSSKLSFQIIFLIFLNLIIKPNFIFCFLPVFPLFMLYKYGLKRGGRLAGVIIVVSVVLLVAQYFWAMRIEETTGNSPVGIGLFHMWGYFTEHVFLSFIASFLFPITFIFCFFKRFRSSLFLKYAVALAVFGLVIYSVFYETGSRMSAGNFAWSAIVSNYILFLACLIDLIKNISKKGFVGWRIYITAFVFLLHVAAGAGYFIKLFLTGNYF